jgi:predicted ATPase/class 3 adenylate cyclase
MVMDIAAWLRSLGLSRYEQAFHDNDVDGGVLPELTADDLIGLGVTSIGHRRKLLAAIAALRAAAPSTPSSATSIEPGSTSAFAPSSSSGDGERRQLTVLFCDLVGSTPLSSQMDLEDLREVIGAYHRCVTETIAGFEGFVAKYMGDGVLAYFGYPQAHEDDAERAVLAGLELVAAVSALRTREASELQCRIGIATGMVVVGDLLGSGAAQEQAVVGETPNLAARLQSLAEPGRVVVAQNTRELIGNLFDCRDLGPVALRGFAENVRAWEVLHPGVVHSRFDALRSTTLTPLVGRDEEIELILRRWHQAKEGDGRVVLLSGEPGIGKSRCTAAVYERLRDEPHLRLRYFCSPQRQDSVLFPFVEQLQRAAGFAHEDPPETKLDKLEILLSHSAGKVLEAVALFADLLALPTDARHPPLTLDPQRKRQLTLAALIGQLEELARKRPVLIVFEDAHWIDPTSRELLDVTVERVAALPVLLIITFRPEFQPPWIGQAHVTALTLSRLDQREGANLVGRVAGGKSLPGEIVAQIIERTDGVPLFIEELTKMVLESGLLRERDGRYFLDRPLRALAIPTSLQASLMARLDRLAPARQMAQIGAAIGRQFSHELVHAVSLLPDNELKEALDRLVASGLIFRRGTPPRAEYIFKHALVQDAAYSTMLRPRRQELHLRIAQALEQRGDAEPEVLAHHYTEALHLERAVDYWLEAGRRAARRSANIEAITHLTKGIDTLGGSPDTPERAQQELSLQLALGPALMATRGWNAPEAERAYSRAQELSERLNDDREHFNAVWGSWLVRAGEGAWDASRDVVVKLFRIAKRVDDIAFSLQAHHAAWGTTTFLGEVTAAHDHVKQGLALYDAEKHRAHALLYGGHDPGVCGYALGGLSLWLLGYPDQAARYAREAVMLAESLENAPSLAHALAFTALCHQLRRDAAAVFDCSNRLVTLARAHGMAQYGAAGSITRGWALAYQGQPEEGLAELRRGLDGYSATQVKAWSVYFRATLAEAYYRAGDAESGLRTVDQAFELSDQLGERFWQAGMLHFKGVMLMSLSTECDAEKCYRAALDIARRQRAKSIELRAATSLARLWHKQGRRRAARDLLAPVRGWFTEGFETADLTEASVLLDELN